MRYTHAHTHEAAHLSLLPRPQALGIGLSSRQSPQRAVWHTYRLSLLSPLLRTQSRDHPALRPTVKSEGLWVGKESLVPQASLAWTAGFRPPQGQ